MVCYKKFIFCVVKLCTVAIDRRQNLLQLKFVTPLENM